MLESWAIHEGAVGQSAGPANGAPHRGPPIGIRKVRGSIPDGEDGAGPVIVWDHGTYDNRTEHEMTTCLGRGHLSFRLDGEKLRGGYALTRIRKGDDETWLLMKRRDDDADTQRDPVRNEPASVLSGRTLDELS